MTRLEESEGGNRSIMSTGTNVFVGLRQGCRRRPGLPVRDGPDVCGLSRPYRPDEIRRNPGRLFAYPLIWVWCRLPAPWLWLGMMIARSLLLSAFKFEPGNVFSVGFFQILKYPLSLAGEPA